ncbi:hypothetical protein CLPUN_22190 [Clostridium puniceum]|uniref:Uncharacterized protein n=1 Tax=Clostridium puniceum TaxID=29367 RepID=A0A1S8TJG9_9CLOT|nr:hypothetical protein [Clostridium puniceum]OOM77545.1 hypothetical protein CLPUN_22190 [Clostridium puniceum]
MEKIIFRKDKISTEANENISQSTDIATEYDMGQALRFIKLSIAYYLYSSYVNYVIEECLNNNFLFIKYKTMYLY